MALRTLQKGASSTFPAGMLDGLDIGIDDVVERQPGAVAARTTYEYVFVHVLKFDIGHSDVRQILESALGKPDVGKPIDTLMMFPGGAYWRTEEGFWICYDRSVYWYSRPFKVAGGDAPSIDDARVDRYVQAAPKSAELWEKLGRALVGIGADAR